MEHGIIAAGLDDGTISAFNLDGYILFSDRSSKTEIRSISYIAQREQIEAFNRDSERLLFTDINKSEDTINLNPRKLILKNKIALNKDYVKDFI